MANFTAHGFYCISNFGGYEIMINNGGDAAKIRENFGVPGTPGRISRWLEIHYTLRENRPFIKYAGRRLHLDNFMRV